MALPHATPGQALDVAPLGDRLASSKTTALFKSTDLELIRLVLPTGRSLPPHQVPGELTIQCLEGTLAVVAESRSHRLEAGQLLYLTGGMVHGVTALADASALVTVVVRKAVAAP